MMEVLDVSLEMKGLRIDSHMPTGLCGNEALITVLLPGLLTIATRVSENSPQQINHIK